MKRKLTRDEIGQLILSRDIVYRIKMWLMGEIYDFNDGGDADSRELGILDGRLECAENLLEQITKWEEEDE